MSSQQRPLIGQPGYNRNYSKQQEMDVDNSYDGNNSQTNNNQVNNGQYNDENNNQYYDNNGQVNNRQYNDGNFLIQPHDENDRMNNIATFESLYTRYNGYKATNTCNPVTARLIIFYNDKLFPFLKKYYISSQGGSSETPTNTLVIQVFIYFFHLIFYQNFYQYKDN